MPDWMGDWTGQLLLFVWALSCALTAVTGWFAGWASGFVRGVRWERSKRQAWLGRERRKEQRPVQVERRAVRPVSTDTAQIPMRAPQQQAEESDPAGSDPLGRS